MVPGKLTVLLKMATPRRYKDPDYMRARRGRHLWRGLARLARAGAQHLRHVRWSSDYGYYLQLIAGFGWSSLPWLRLLPQPTLVMAGTDDPIVPVANGRILARVSFRMRAGDHRRRRRSTCARARALSSFLPGTGRTAPGSSCR